MEPLRCLEVILLFAYAGLVLVFIDATKILLRLWKYTKRHMEKRKLCFASQLPSEVISHIADGSPTK